MDNYILEANLYDALVLAVRTLKEREAKVSPTFCSTFRAGLEMNLANIRAGYPLRIA